MKPSTLGSSLALLLAATQLLLGQATPADPAEDLYFSANGLYNRQLYDLAADRYEAFLQKHAKHAKAPAARLGLGLSLQAAGNVKAAETHLRKLAKAGGAPDRVRVNTAWGHCLLGLKKFKEARDAFDQALRHARSDEAKAEAVVGLAESLHQLRQWKDVIGAGAKLGKLGTKDQRERIAFRTGWAHYQLKAYDKAIAALAPLTADGVGPLTERAFFVIGECKRETGDIAGAADAYGKAAAIGGNATDEAMFRQGYVRFHAGDHDKAAAVFDAFLKDAKRRNGPLGGQAGVYQGRARFAAGNFSESARLLKPWAGHKTAGAAAALWLGRALQADKKTDEAVGVLNQALAQHAKDPRAGEIAYDLGRLEMARRRFEPAAKAFERAAQILGKQPAADDALWYEALCLHRAKRYQDSANRCEAFAKLRGRQPTRTAGMAYLGAENLFLIKRYGAARTAFERAIGRWPKNPQVTIGHLRLGQIAWQDKRWADATRSLKTVAETKPTAAVFEQADYLLGDSHYRLKQWAPAAAAFERFVTQHPKAVHNDAALFKLGRSADQLKQAEAARRWFEQLAKRHPKKSPYTPHGLVELGRLQYEAKAFDAAEKTLRRVGRYGDSPHASYYLGYVALARDKAKDAADHFEKLQTKYPEHTLAAEAALELAKGKIQDERFAEAQKSLERFVKKTGADHPKAADGLFYLGVALARQQQWAAGSAKLEALVAKHPKTGYREQALYELAWCAKGLKQDDRAAVYYDQLLSAFPKGQRAAEAVLERSELDFKAKRYDQAIARLKPAIRRTPEGKPKARILRRLGWNYFKSKQMLPAAEAFEASLAIQGKGEAAVVATYQAGEARLKLREYPQALAHYQAVVGAGASGKLHERGMLRVGEAAGLALRWDESEKAYRSLLKVYPKSRLVARGRYGLGWALQNQKRFDEAIAAYRTVLAEGRRDETACQTQFQIGECYFEKKDHDQAIKELISVTINYAYPKWSARALLEVGRALEVQGRGEQARARYEELLRTYPDSRAAEVAKDLLAKMKAKQGA